MRFNNSLVKDQEFQDSTNEIIRDTIKEYLVFGIGEDEVDDDTLGLCGTRISPILLFELILSKVKGNTIQFSANKRRKVEDHFSTVLNKIENLERKVNKSNEPMQHILDKTQLLKHML